MTDVEQQSEVVETQTVTTKTAEDGSVVTEITVTKIVTGEEGQESTTTVTTTTTEEVVKENGESDPQAKVEDADENAKADDSDEAKADTTTGEGAAGDEGAKEGAVAAGAAHVEEEKKEEQPSPRTVVLHQLPAGRTIPNYSPFCLKLETYLRIHKIPYMSSYGYKVGKKGKLPWIEYNGEKVADSSFCIDYLNKSFEVNLDQHLDENEQAQARAFKSMIEENTYWALVYRRWVDDYSEFKKAASPSSFFVQTVGFKLNQRKAKAMLEHQGMGRHSREEIYEIAEKDLRALSVFLGDKKYFMGDKVTTLDCSAFGLLGNFMYDSLESPMATLIKEELKNLAAFCDRMKEEFWSDWNDVVQGDKPEPNLSKKYSFRKGKKKKSHKDDKKEEAAEDAETNKDEKKDEEQATEDDSATAATPATNGDASDEQKQDKTDEGTAAE